MAEAELNIEIELCGHKGRITHISVSEAYLPWRPLDTLCVWVKFDEPYPESVISMGVQILSKDYSREELLAVVKNMGEEQFILTFDRHRKEREEMQRQQERREKLGDLAKKLESVLRENAR